MGSPSLVGNDRRNRRVFIVLCVGATSRSTLRSCSSAGMPLQPSWIRDRIPTKLSAPVHNVQFESLVATRTVIENPGDSGFTGLAVSSIWTTSLGCGDCLFKVYKKSNVWSIWMRPLYELMGRTRCMEVGAHLVGRLATTAAWSVRHVVRSF